MIRVGLIGAGIGPSLTPALHLGQARHLGLAYDYHLLDTLELGFSAADLSDVLAGLAALGFTGVNVTHPFKVAVLATLDRLTPVAAAIGAVNHVQFTPTGWLGDNTDAAGFAATIEALRAAGAPVRAQDRVVVVGAGGAGRAAVHALLVAGSQHIEVVDAQDTRATELVVALRRAYPKAGLRARPFVDLPGLLPGAAGVVHATPTGMAEHPGAAIDPGLLDRHAWVADVVYRPLRTELLTRALARGLVAVDGSHMALGQAVESFRRFSGVEPDAARMGRHLHRLLADGN